MKFEVEKKSHKKGLIIGISIILILGIVLVVKNSFAKYSSVKTIHLVNSTVNYTKGDFSIVAMYKNDGSGDVAIDRMPDSGYAINQDKSYCTLNGEKDNNAKLYTNSNGGYEIKGLAKGSKCYLYFDKYLEGKDLIIANQGGSKGKYNETDTFTGIATAADTGIYETEDDHGTSYYFRGLNDYVNNWVKFAGFYWRIIRINGNGSIRMIYSGLANGLPSSSNIKGTVTQIKESAYGGKYRENVYNAYVGYMFGTIGASNYEDTHANINDSIAKTEIDKWYETNIDEKTDSKGKSYSTYLDVEAGFCNDRGLSSGTGTGTSDTYYASHSRFFWGESSNFSSSQTPTLKCINKDNDLFTTNDSNIGNKALTYPVGLITIDEAVYAGGFAGRSNTSYYLYTNLGYWTMSPLKMYWNGGAIMLFIYDAGEITSTESDAGKGIRPVINLKANVTMTGTGSETDPYIVIS